MKISFIGCGNMGSALLRAIVKQIPPKDVLISEPDEKRREALAASLGVATGSNADAAGTAAFLFLAVKPQILPAVLDGIAPVLSARGDRFVVVTMAAGVTIAAIRERLGPCPVIRIMPNLPVSVGEGMILCAYDGVTEEEKTAFASFMKQTGRLVTLEESKIDAGTAVSGCGPAFVCLFVEALADGGVQCGLPRDKATAMAIQTLLGTAKMLQENEIHPAALKDAVCSPGGSTIAGVHALEEGAFRSDASNAVLAAYRRTRELGS